MGLSPSGSCHGYCCSPLVSQGCGHGLWAGAFHVFFPATAAKLIGWDMSPFQLEVGMADLAIGATACIAFWRDLNFKAAAISAAAIFLLGDAIGHVKQM